MLKLKISTNRIKKFVNAKFVRNIKLKVLCKYDYFRNYTACILYNTRVTFNHIKQ